MKENDKRLVGWLPFSLTIAFSMGQLWSLACAAKGCLTGVPWCNLSGHGAIVGFFGFGIPMLITSIATTHIWHGHANLKIYGWASSALGSIFGICLFITVGYVATMSKCNSPALIIFFIAFSIPMIFLGTAGLRSLYRKPCCHWND